MVIEVKLKISSVPVSNIPQINSVNNISFELFQGCTKDLENYLVWRPAAAQRRHIQASGKNRIGPSLHAASLIDDLIVDNCDL